MTVADRDALLAAQGGACAICGGPPLGKGVYHLDHDHETGNVRGLLCHACNTSLGGFRDDPELLRKAIAYLEDPPVPQTGEIRYRKGSRGSAA